MLVLSRRENEKVVFPRLGVSIEVLRIDGRVTRLGIDAPSDVRVLRGELSDHEAGNDAAIPAETPLVKSFRHAIRNRLNIASLGLQVLQRRLETSDIDDAEATVAKIVSELREIDAELESTRTIDLTRVSEALPLPARQRRALIVDDSANESELLAAYLRLNGYTVEIVSDGLEALAYLKNHEHPDFVLLDMIMPKCGGPQTIAAIRGNPALKGLRVFAVTGADQRETGVTFGRFGVDHWFSKPVNARELVHEMERCASSLTA